MNITLFRILVTVGISILFVLTTIFNIIIICKSSKNTVITNEKKEVIRGNLIELIIQNGIWGTVLASSSFYTNNYEIKTTNPILNIILFVIAIGIVISLYIVEFMSTFVTYAKSDKWEIDTYRVVTSKTIFILTVLFIISCASIFLLLGVL